MDNEVGSSDSCLGTLSCLFIIIAILAILVVFNKKDTWQGFYYPDAGNLLSFTKSPVFTSLDECRNWVNTQIYQYNPDGYGYDYECGKNCRLKEGFTSPVCKETVR